MGVDKKDTLVITGAILITIAVVLSIVVVSSMSPEKPAKQILQPKVLPTKEGKVDVQKDLAKIKEMQELCEFGWAARSKEKLDVNELAFILSGVCRIQSYQRAFLKEMKEEFERETLPLRIEIEARYNKSLEEATARRKKKRRDVEETTKRLLKSSIEELIQNMKSSKDLVLLICSIEAICKLDKRRAVLPLIDLLKNENWEVRRDATYNLGYLKDKRAVEPLIELLNDENKEVRSHAEGALLGISLTLGKTENWQEWWEKEKNKNK